MNDSSTRNNPKGNPPATDPVPGPELAFASVVEATLREWRKPEFDLPAPVKPGDPDGKKPENNRFLIWALLVMEGFEVYEELRSAIAGMFRDLRQDGSRSFSMLAILIGLPPDVRERVQDTLFSEITFRPPGGRDMLPLRGNEGLAFRNVEQVYEVLGRALIVNFPNLPSLLGHALPLLLGGLSRSDGGSARRS